MATLIPALGTCVSRMTAGERRVAERLEQKLDEDKDDGIPLLKPISCGRNGEAPLIIRLPTLREEAFDHLNSVHKEGCACGDMAVICRYYAVMDECASALARRKLPYQVRKAAGSFKPNADTIKVLTMHASKGLEFAVVALAGVGQMPAEGHDEQEEARLFYVAATRATHRLVITASGDGGFVWAEVGYRQRRGSPYLLKPTKVARPMLAPQMCG